MKNTFNTYLILLGFFGSISLGCDNILDQESQIFLEEENPIKDPRSAQSALNGMYDAMQDGDLYGASFILANELTAGNGKAGGFSIQWLELETGIIPTVNFHVEDNWPAFYLVINTANSILESIPKGIGVTGFDSTNIMGQAHFVRGLAFFDLLRQYGEFDQLGSEFGIPLPLKPIFEPTNIARSTVQATYDQVFADLLAAENLLEYSNDKGFASRGAVEALLARVYLFYGDYDKAFEYADRVISSQAYSLLTDYNANYSTKQSDESIFELEFSLQDPNSMTSILQTKPPEVLASSELIASFESSDVRQELFASSGDLKCFKYGDDEFQGDGNVILFRLAEMYLIRAEAYARNDEFGNAVADINTLRNRAGASSYNPNLFNSTDEVIDLILNEKRLEFAFENGNYWYDIARLGKLTELRGLPAYRRIYPIPERETRTDELLRQNPQY